MKKLLKFMACALAVSFGLTACDDGKQSHHPWDVDGAYKPQGSHPQLNTSHSLVGKMFGVDHVVDSVEEAQGIVFAVSTDGKTAYLVSFTDAMIAGASSTQNMDVYNFNAATGGYFAPERMWGPTWASQYDTTMERVEENGISRIDTVINKRAVIHDLDGEINTQAIIDNIAFNLKRDTTLTPPSMYAARACRLYYRRQWGAEELFNSRRDEEQDPLGKKWISTKGEWYLPSIEELGALMKNRDKINKMYDKCDSLQDMVSKPYFFMPIGGETGHAYWSSSEFNVQCAWYCLSEVRKGTGYPGNKRYGYFQKNDKKNMYVRPIRKAPIK